jgi:hypothetical protein
VYINRRPTILPGTFWCEGKLEVRIRKSVEGDTRGRESGG